jgi:hypothetical protein
MWAESSKRLVLVRHYEVDVDDLAMDRHGSRLCNDIAHMQEMSRHRQQMPIYDSIPQVDQAWVAPNASLSKIAKRDSL